MRQIAKWTILCVLCTAVGFGATYGVAHSDRLLQTVAAMLPVPANSATEKVTLEELAANVSSADAGAVELGARVAAANREALASLSAGESTVGTFAAGAQEPEAALAQTSTTEGPLTAVGVVTVVRDRQVVLGAGGRVDEVNVEVGDPVKAGDVLIALDTTYLDWAVEQAEIALETARIDFEEAGKEVDDADIAVAEANLLLAQENLAEVEAGPTAEQLAAAEANAAAAWSSLDLLQAGPDLNARIIAQASLRRAEIAVEAAQREFDKIAWLPESAATSAADDLQSATIDLEAARAAYSDTMKAPTVADIQSATASAQSAQDALNELQLKPTPAELASARASLASAEAALADVQEGPQQAGVRKAELGVRQAMIALEDARLAQAAAEVLAPVDGTVLAVNVDLGQQAGAGDVVVLLANTSDVKLTVNVEQRDISRVVIGQQVQIAIYALPNDEYTGVVEQIAPIAEAGTGFVTFPVIIRFTSGPMEKVLPGMTASATFVPIGEEGAAAPAAGAATAEPTEEATEEAAATEEATVEATEEPTEEATEEVSEEASEATPEATEEPAEEPAVEATATPGN